MVKYFARTLRCFIIAVLTAAVMSCKQHDIENEFDNNVSFSAFSNEILGIYITVKNKNSSDLCIPIASLNYELDHLSLPLIRSWSLSTQ